MESHTEFTMQSFPVSHTTTCNMHFVFTFTITLLYEIRWRWRRRTCYRVSGSMKTVFDMGCSSVGGYCELSSKSIPQTATTIRRREERLAGMVISPSSLRTPPVAAAAAATAMSVGFLPHPGFFATRPQGKSGSLFCQQSISTFAKYA